MNLEKIINLFEDKHTESLSDRHAAAINKLCKRYNSEGKGFFYRDIPEISKILHLIHVGFQNGKFKLIPALGNFLELLKIPFKKAKCSDENNHVPLLPKLFNSLCPLLKFECSDGSMGYDQITAEIANLITEFASYGVRQLREKEADEAEKAMYGTESRLYKNGTRNLIGIAGSEVPETLVTLLAENKKGMDIITLLIEALASCSLYEPNSLKFSSMGVLKDLVLLMADAPDFRSYIVRISSEAIWNIIEVVGNDAVKTMATEGEIVLALRRIFERVLKEGYKLDDK